MSQTILTIEHALDILELFTPEKPHYSISEIIQATHLHRSTIYRILSLLIRRNYLEKSSYKGYYTLGIRLISLASTRINDLELITEARPFMFRLYSITGLGSQLCILDGTEVLYLDEVNSLNIRKYTYRGVTGPAYCSSLGKCLLAALSRDELERLFKDYPFKQFTPTTITSLNRLEKELRRVRRQGYAINTGEYSASLASIAVPIYDYNGDTCAAISLGIHISSGIITSRISELLPHLKNASMEISKRLGYIS
jgi:DNA-binding IclR family transcriptional regulator